MRVDCFICGDELEEPGALYFTPPRQDSTTKKLHICRGCDVEVRKTFTKVRRAVHAAQPQRLANIVLPPDVETAARSVVAAWTQYKQNEEEELDFDLLFAVGEAIEGLGAA